MYLLLCDGTMDAITNITLTEGPSYPNDMQFDARIEHIISKSDIVKSYWAAFKVRPAPMTIEVAMAI